MTPQHAVDRDQHLRQLVVLVLRRLRQLAAQREYHLGRLIHREGALPATRHAEDRRAVDATQA